MKSNKLVYLSIFAMLMTGCLANVTKTVALASTQKIDNGTVVIGTESFNLSYANSADNIIEINAAITGGGKVYIKDFAGIWTDNNTGKVVSESVIPTIITSITGNESGNTSSDDGTSQPYDPSKVDTVGHVGTAVGKIDDPDYGPKGFVSGNLLWFDPYENQNDETTTEMLSCFCSPGFSQAMLDSINLNTGRSFIASDVEGKNKINVLIRAYNVIADGKAYINGGTQFIFNEDRKATFKRYTKGGTYYFFITNQYGEYQEFNDGTTPLLHPEATRGYTIRPIIIFPN